MLVNSLLMIKLHKIIIIISTLLLCNQLLYSQKIEVGPEIGFGRSEISEFYIIINPFNKDYSDNFRFGLIGYFYPKKERFSVNSGIIYNQRGNYDDRLYFLRTPVRVDINFGKKIKIIAGGGIYIQLLIGDNSFVHSNFNSTKRSFQLGGGLNVGIGYQFSSKITFIVKYDNNFDLTRIYEGTSYSMGLRQIYYYGMKGCDTSVCFCLRYNIKCSLP